jgi:hypothetical protein
MLSIRIEPGFNGPSLPEMLPLLIDTDQPVEVAWENTRLEISLLDHVRHKQLTLVVKDLATMERSATTIGVPFIFDQDLKTSAVQALNSKSDSNWRALAAQLGPGVARGLLIEIASDFLKKGKSVKPLRSVVNGMMFDGVSSFDSDVLFGLAARM